MHLLDRLQVCPGHSDEHFVLKITRAKEGQLISSSAATLTAVLMLNSMTTITVQLDDKQSAIS